MDNTHQTRRHHYPLDLYHIITCHLSHITTALSIYYLLRSPSDSIVMRLTSALALLLCSAGFTLAFIAPPLSRTHILSRTLLPATPGADIEENTTPRGKVNEIDFCIAPADASLSQPTASLTRYLNNASNRAVRRILLARSWPSAEALNLSLRQVLSAPSSSGGESTATAKCPVPRPILNILTRRRDNNSDPASTPMPRSRSDEEYVQDQLKNFREAHADAPGLEMAVNYLDCVLSLATSGTESECVKEVRIQLRAPSLRRLNISDLPSCDCYNTTRFSRWESMTNPIVV